MTIFPKQTVIPVEDPDAHAEMLLAMGFDEEDWHGNLLRKGSGSLDPLPEATRQAGQPTALLLKRRPGVPWTNRTNRKPGA